MKYLAALTLIASLLSMTFAAASQAPARSVCSPQIRAANMCHAIAPPAAQTGTADKSGPCCELFPAMDRADIPRARAASALIAILPMPGAHVCDAPWRPPRTAFG